MKNSGERVSLLVNQNEPGEKVFVLFGKWFVSFRAVLGVISLGVILGSFGQQVSLPLYLSTFGELVGAFFVLWSCSLVFTIFFGIGAIFLIFKGVVTREMLQAKWIPYMVLVGVFDSFNGIMVVYSAFLGRVPGALQTVLLQGFIPATLILSKIIVKKKYTVKQLIGAAFVLMGVIVSLVPLFVRFGSGEADTKVAGWWWPLIVLLSTIPGALMNIVQEKMQDDFRATCRGTNKRYSVFYFQAVESFFQWVAMTIMFWTDLVPYFGTSSNISVFWNSFTFDWRCFFGVSSAISVDSRCEYSAPLGILFMSAYILSYIASTFMTLYASANLSSIVSAIAPILAVLFWFSFPSVNLWAGGSPYSAMDIACNISALVPILIGIYLFRRNEQEEKKPDEDEGEVELCF